MLNYDRKRILTKEGCTPAKWWPKEFLMPEHIIGDRKNSSNNSELYYAGQWQELVLKENRDATLWAEQIII